jgi:hypothetical protein
MNNPLLEMEENFRHKETHKAYKRIKEIKNGFMARTDLCRDKDGSIISNPEVIQSRWKQYFENLLNTEITRENPEILILPQLEDYEFKDPPTKEDITISIQALRNRRAPDIDGIPAEIFKLGSDQLVSLLQDIFADVWKEEHIPEDWCHSLICQIYKKGDKLTCNNYRGISLH